MKINSIYSLLIILLSIFISCSPTEVVNEPTINNILNKTTVDTSSNNIVVAHRGAWKKNNLPQNSIASLREAIRLQCKGSEFDIWLTADDSLIVNHDPTYHNIDIQKSKYADLVKFKLSNGEMIPTLRQYIEAAKQNNVKTKLFCHFKDNLSTERKKVFAVEILNCINKLNAQYLIIYLSDSYNLLKELRAKDNLIDTRYLLGTALPPEQLKKDNISGLFYFDYAYYNNPDWINRAIINNLTLSVSTLNDASGMKWFLQNNFDAILTDEPELALTIKP